MEDEKPGKSPDIRLFHRYNWVINLGKAGIKPRKVLGKAGIFPVKQFLSKINLIRPAGTCSCGIPKSLIPLEIDGILPVNLLP